MVDQWEKYVDLMADSVFVNSGRGCINCSGVWVSKHGKKIPPRGHRGQDRADRTVAAGGPGSRAIAAFTVPGQADAINKQIDADLKESGVYDMTAKYGSRLSQEAFAHCDYMRPTVVYCESPEKAIAKKEYMFPFVTVVECPQKDMLAKIGPTLVCSAITEDAKFQRALADATHIDRLNIGAIKTIALNWLQPHEGSIVDFLFRGRAFQFDKDRIKI